MAYLTDRKRATGMGSAKSGAADHWGMTVSSYGLLVLVPLFVFTFGFKLGAPYEEVVAYFARPFPAIVAALTLTVGFLHFKNGIRIAIEDYAHGYTREILIIATTCLSYAAIATGLFAIARIAI